MTRKIQVENPKDTEQYGNKNKQTPNTKIHTTFQEEKN